MVYDAQRQMLTKCYITMYFIHGMYKELNMINNNNNWKKEEKLHQLLFIIKGLINGIIPMKV